MAKIVRFSGKLFKRGGKMRWVKVIQRLKERTRVACAKLRVVVEWERSQAGKAARLEKKAAEAMRAKGNPERWPGRCLACVYRYAKKAGGPAHAGGGKCLATATWLKKGGGRAVERHYKAK